MSNSLFVTIYIALIASAIMAVLMIALQVVIFILIQKGSFNFLKNFKKNKRTFLSKINNLLNPVFKISKVKKA